MQRHIEKEHVEVEIVCPVEGCDAKKNVFPSRAHLSTHITSVSCIMGGLWY